MSDSSSKAPDPPLVPGERVKVTHVRDSRDEEKLGSKGTVREWRGYEVIVDLDSGLQKSGPGPLLRLSPGFLVRLEEPADTAVGEKMAFVCARCGELRYKRYDRKIQYECPKCIEKKMYHPQLRKARKRAGRLTPLEKDKKPMVCPECGSVEYRDESSVDGRTCQKCERDMLSPSERKELSEREKKRKKREREKSKEESKEKKKWVCDRCGRVKHKDPDITGTMCPECGVHMSRPSVSGRKKRDQLEPKEKDLKGEEGRDSGYVYVLVSSEKPNLAKIGSTERSPEKRAKELSSRTAVAMPFIVAYQAEANNPEEVERAVHNRLSDRRVNPDREFFKVETRQVIEIIEQEMRAQK